MVHRPRSRLARGAFLGFLAIATAVASVASFTVLVPGTALSSVWAVKEHSYHQLLQHRGPAGAGFAALALILAVTAGGWARRRRWAWLLSVALIAVNLLSDIISLVAARQPADLAGVAVGAAILAWLLTPATRSHFT